LGSLKTHMYLYQKYFRLCPFLLFLSLAFPLTSMQDLCFSW
jgi:hypothetical protein